MKYKPWEIWAENSECEGTLVERAKGNLPEMESTKQLVKLISEIYQPGMKVLDAGCNTGHYLKGLRRLDENLDYTGIDAYEVYISQANEIFKNDNNADFILKSLLDENFLFNEKYDVTFSCNVLLHLPGFKLPMKNILENTKEYCFIRTLFGKRSTIVRLASEEGMDYQEDGNPIKYIHQNTYDRLVFSDYVKSLGWKIEFIKDEYNPEILATEHKTLKKGSGTNIIDGKQVDGNIIFNWEWAKIYK